MNYLKVVDVNTNCESLSTRGVVVDEYAAIGVIELSQTHDVGAPGEDFALKAPSSLWNAIDGLLDDADHGAGRDADWWALDGRYGDVKRERRCER